MRIDTAEPIGWMGLPYSAEIALPPLAGIILIPEAYILQ